ncbi:MAG TPA: hypothetical protein ENK35_00415 [Candidatus Tenderia sp.]|nr:hypothetical protein [Candidatus Tenderia sp.]
MKKVNRSIGLLVLVLLFPGSVWAAEAEETFLRIERSKQTEEMGLRVTSLGVFGTNKGKIGHMDLSYIESADNGDGLALDFGAGVSFRAGATFFLGAGFLLGYNSDNSDFISAYYPQVGVVAHLTKTFALMVTGKRYYALYDNSEDENIVTFGLLFGSR